jgi:hypothetical protein
VQQSPDSPVVGRFSVMRSLTEAGLQVNAGVGALEFSYDANGNQTLQRQGTTDLVDFAWTGFDLPYRVR